MTLSEIIGAENQTPAAFARRVGCHRSYLSHVLAGRKSLSRPAAIRIWRETGHKLGPIAEIADSDIEVLERVG